VEYPVFPALSRHQPANCWFNPLAPTTPVEQASTPAKVSVPLKTTFTAVLFQPSALGRGESVYPVCGAVLSIEKLTVFPASLFPALSTA
jgi:hypothetical protein